MGHSVVLKKPNRSVMSERDFRIASPAHFAYYASGKTWRPYPHLMVINDKLLEIANKSLRRLRLSVPPQHGKSLFVSCYFLAWLIGMFPDTRVIFVSYEYDYAVSWGRKVRDVLREHGHLFGVAISKEVKAAGEWEIEGRRGGMRSAGMGGAITGKSADVLVIDDPVKNQQEALSETIRESHKNFYSTTLRTRVQKHGAIILIMTRWHLDDLSGHLRRLEESGGEKFGIINMPAIALAEEEIPEGMEGCYPDPVGREPGEALCPQLHDLDEFEAMRATMGESFFWALMMGHPIPGTGGMFSPEWFVNRWKLEDLPVSFDATNARWFYPTDDRFDEIIQSWDFSFKDTKRSDFVVGQVWAKRGAQRFLLDQIRERMDLSDSVYAVAELKRRWPMCRAILVENKANGPDVEAILKKVVPGLILTEPKGPKQLRAQAWSYRAKAGDILIPPTTFYSWVRDWISEICSFPLGLKDDQVDSASQANGYFEDGVIDISTLISRIKIQKKAKEESRRRR